MWLTVSEGLLIPFLGTVLGSACVFFMKKELSRSVQRALTGFAATEIYNTVSDNAIPDVKMDDANADAIYTFYRAGILTGSDGSGTFNPNSAIKRSEVAAILSRMFDSNVRQSITLG